MTDGKPPSAYPLQWPAGWPRTAPNTRSRWPNQVTLPAALNDLTKEMRLLGVKQVVLSSNCTLGMDNASDPGVVAYGQYDGQQIGIPCDRWSTVAANVRAIAKTIEAMRGMERWGAKHMIRAMFQGFAAISPPDDWQSMLGNPKSLAEAEQSYRTKMRTAHPDAGGSHGEASALNTAIAEARKVFA